jgi:predicted DNA-binding protein
MQYTKSLLIRMSEDMYDDVQKVSKQRGMKVAEFIRDAIRESTPEQCACGLKWSHTGKHARI